MPLIYPRDRMVEAVEEAIEQFEYAAAGYCDDIYLKHAARLAEVVDFLKRDEAPLLEALEGARDGAVEDRVARLELALASLTTGAQATCPSCDGHGRQGRHPCARCEGRGLVRRVLPYLPP